MYFSIFLRGAGHLKHLEIRSPRKEDQEQTCGAHGRSVVHMHDISVMQVSPEQRSIGCRKFLLLFYFTKLSGWLENLAPLSQSIRCATTTDLSIFIS